MKIIIHQRMPSMFLGEEAKCPFLRMLLLIKAMMGAIHEISAINLYKRGFIDIQVRLPRAFKDFFKSENFSDYHLAISRGFDYCLENKKMNDQNIFNNSWIISNIDNPEFKSNRTPMRVRLSVEQYEKLEKLKKRIFKSPTHYNMIILTALFSLHANKKLYIYPCERFNPNKIAS